MADFITDNSLNISQPRIRFSLADDCALPAQWLLDYFANGLANGAHFAPGQTVQIGWMIVQLQAAEEGVLEVWEPDFQVFPIRWIRGVNWTLRHVILQRSICDELKCEPEFPSLRHSGVMSRGFKISKDFKISRDTPNAADSGWVFMEPGYSGTQGEYQSLYQLALWNMRIVPFLALPPGTPVTRLDNEIEISRGVETLAKQQSKLLQRLVLEQP